MKEWMHFDIFQNFPNLYAGSTKKDESFPLAFSLALHTLHNENEKKDALNNRKVFMKQFPKNFYIVSLLQVHGNKVLDLDTIKLQEKWSELALNADGLVTTKPNLLLTILTADCAAILAYEPKADVIGAVHAGWRGTKKQIVKNMIDLMLKKGAKKENILIAMSPMIRKCCYEVDIEVAKEFFAYPKAIKEKLNQKFMLDIAIVNKEILMKLGIKEKNIQISPHCTSCCNKSFFSFRKGDKKGRFISYIGKIELT